MIKITDSFTFEKDLPYVENFVNRNICLNNKIYITKEELLILFFFVVPNSNFSPIVFDDSTKFYCIDFNELFSLASYVFPDLYFDDMNILKSYKLAEIHSYHLHFLIDNGFIRLRKNYKRLFRFGFRYFELTTFGKSFMKNLILNESEIDLSYYKKIILKAS